MTTNQALQFRKTKSGEWVAFGPVASIKVGWVAIKKSDGSTVKRQVVRVGNAFTVEGVQCAYGYLSEDKQVGTSPRSNRSESHNCAECGRPGAATLCYDSSGISGYCCHGCARMSQHERSFG